ncbi:iron chelate uptake ABC transporter family permease subunit [Rhodococcus aerolatus]
MSVASRPALRVGPVSLVARPRAAAVVVVLVAALAVASLVEVALGDYPLGPGEVLGVLAGGGSRAARVVVLELRLPRALTGLLVGAALGLAGAITQSVTRNALASPDVLGVTAGASAAAVGVIVLGGGTATTLLGAAGLPLAALLGGLGTALLLHLLAWRDGLDGVRLVLVGIGLGAVLVAVTSYLLVRADITQAAQATVWLTGSLNARGWEHVVPVALAVVPVGLLVLVHARTLAALRLGEDTARSLGVPLQRAQTGLLLAAVVLASVATAAAGPVTFVALVAPQVALRLVRSAGPPLLAAALVGALLVVAGDLVARVVLPVELPVGIVTAAVGGPVLLRLLVRRTREATA